MSLSVVVPVHNVAPYLAEALDSVLAQDDHLAEVIAVDDGSTDESPAILASYAERRPDLLRVITTDNAGSGAARNLAAGQAEGDYLTFVDPDDVVLPGTWGRMLELLDRTGSDFAVCHFERLHADGGRSTLRWADRVHATPRERARLDDVPEIVGDVFCWNKVFRRDFWQDHGLAFPEGTRYQDQPAVTEAFLRSTAFDVTPEVGYLWRVREDGSSVTQGRAELGNLQDRVTTKRDTWNLVRELGSPRVQEAFRDRVAPGDLHQFFAALADCDDDYWELFRSMLLELWGPEHSLARTRLLPSHRLMGWLVEQDRRADATALWGHVASATRPLPVRPTADQQGLALDTSALFTDAVPEDVVRLRDDEIGWDATAEEVRRGWRGHELTGTVAVRRLGAREPFRLKVRSLEAPVLTHRLDTPHGPVTLTGPVTLPTTEAR
ncbi:glycosyltransferase family 2 protein [Nocardioides euryhalodurans]|uniref:Glycosyltransferase family 2 protein n=1 Tax=Nocardioides euryhalodurans TaxID=2518370 RepID=A0A4P7GGI7_9ACTN|nr:glycosyltransferase family 2 protein [Nocardioides euryhalodurans]QBR90970.1 glycosyltransferase family 2 protein [Nocardioides euryhalodurans]